MKIKRRTKKKKTYKRKLSDKRRKFVNEYIVDFNATRAARQAGYSKKTASVIGFQLLREPIVQVAIKEEMARRAKRTKITQDKVLYDLETQRQLAIKNRQFTPAMRASELHGKHLAMFTDKIQTEHDVVLQLKDNMEIASYGLIDTLKQLAGETGIEEVELKEVKRIRHLKIKRRKKRPKALLLENGNGGNKTISGNGKEKTASNKILKNTLVSQADTEDTNKEDTPPKKSISLPDWQPLSDI